MDQPSARILVMAKAPVAGRAKTRLEPLLGAAGCARLQAALVRHTVATAVAVAPSFVAVAGPRELVIPLVGDVPIFDQGDGDLGARMTAAVQHVRATARPAHGGAGLAAPVRTSAGVERVGLNAGVVHVGAASVSDSRCLRPRLALPQTPTRAAVGPDSRGGGVVVVVGTDCPQLGWGHIRAALEGIVSGAGVVFGPAHDGGYYLVALAAMTPIAPVFALPIDAWGGPHVLELSYAAAQRAGLHPGLIAVEHDLDTPADATLAQTDPRIPPHLTALLRPPTPARLCTPPHPRHRRLEHFCGQGRLHNRSSEPFCGGRREVSAQQSVAIVVPALDEEGGIGGCLRRLRADFPECVVVVVDGGSTDRTVEVAGPLAGVVCSERGRARQMNAGAAATSSDVLWFVHADCTVAPEALSGIRAALADPGVVGGGLRIRFDRRTAGLEFLRVTSNWRARVLGQVFGDQAMFVRRSVFDELGGFPAMALMEDYEMSRRLRTRGRLVVLDAETTASSRRILTHGPWRMTVLMQWLKLQYVAGVDPERIRRRYERGTRRGRRARRSQCRNQEG